MSMHKKKRRKTAFRRRTAPGEESGIVLSDSQVTATSLEVFQYSAAHVTERTVQDVAELKSLRESEGTLWLNVDGLGNADIIQQVGSIFGLHPLALEDVVHTHQRAKTEEYDDFLYVVARMHSEAHLHGSEQVSFFLGPKWVITFQEQGGDCFDNVRHRLRHDKGRLRKSGPDYLVYALIDAVIDAYFPIAEQFSAELDDIEDLMILNRNAYPLRQLHRVRRELREFRRVLWPHREAINGLLRAAGETVRPETQFFLRDCYDHVVQLIDVAETLKETCTDLRELHLAELGQRTNDVTKVLTIIAVLFLPMSFVAGLYGMNFDTSNSPWNMPELHWEFGYPFALSLMALLEAGLLTYLWRQGWIGRSDVFADKDDSSDS